MKRHATRPVKPVKKDAKRRAEFPRPASHQRAPVQRNPNSAIRYSPQVGLPANEKLKKFADEIYGAIEIPAVSRKK
jgi:hypothetical protein